MVETMIAAAPSGGDDDEGAEDAAVATKKKGGRRPCDESSRAGGPLIGTLVIRTTAEVERGVKFCNKKLKGFTKSDTARAMLLAAARAAAEDPNFLAKGVISS